MATEDPLQRLDDDDLVDSIPPGCERCSGGWVELTEVDVDAQCPPVRPQQLGEPDDEYRKLVLFVNGKRSEVRNSALPCSHCMPRRYKAWRDGRFHGSAQPNRHPVHGRPRPQAQRSEVRPRRDVD